MKKKIKKYSLISTSIIAMTTSISFPIMGAYNGVTPSSSNNVGSNVANENTTNSGNGKITVGGNTYQTIEEAIDDFIDKNVRQGQYLGDLDAATSTGDIKTVDLSQLIEVEDADRIERAYRKLDGTYTPNLEDAKRSHINTTVVKYLNNSGDEFDSQEEALKSMAYDYDKYTNEIGYYEISDYSQLDVYGRPKVYLINPLNSEDQKVLKEIATRNAFITDRDTGFTLTRKVANSSGVYQNQDFQGMYNSELTKTADQIVGEIVDVIKKNLWINSKIDVEPDTAYQNAYSGFRWENYYTHNWKSGSTYNDIINDAEKLADRNYKYNSHFKTTFPAKKSNDIWGDFVVKEGEFGGQNVRFRLDDGLQNNKKESVTRRTNYYTIFWHENNGIFQDDEKFEIQFNQKKYTELLNSDYNFRKERERVANDVRNKVRSILTSDLGQYVSSRPSETNTIIESVSNEAYNIMMSDIISGYDISVSGVTTKGQVQKTLDILNDVIANRLRNSGSGIDLSSRLFNHMKYDQQTRESLASTDVIYTIDYNGIPLYWLNEETLVSPIYSTEEYKVNPSKAIKDYYLDLMRKDYTGTVAKISSGLKNVSGSLEITNAKTTGLTRQSIDNYANPNTKKANFPLSTSIGGSFATNVKLFDEIIYSNNGITKDKLNVSLLRREDQDHSLLNNPYGTFMAVEDYNRSLKKYSEIKNPSKTLIDNVNKNALKDTNEVVALYDKDGTPKNIKYGRHLTYDHKFNPSLTNGETRVYGSEEALQNEFKIENIDLPRKVYKFYDYNAELVDQQIIEPIDGKYNVSADQAYQNALNKVNVSASTDYVYYRKEDDSLVLTKNEVSNIYVLTIDTNERAIFTYGFVTVTDLRDYVENYIIAEQGSGNGSITPNPDPTPSPAPNKTASILNGFYVALAIVIVANIIVTSAIFVKKSRNNNVNLNIKK